MSRAEIHVERVIDRSLAKRRRMETAHLLQREAAAVVSTCMARHEPALRLAMAKALLSELGVRLAELDGKLHAACLLSAASQRIAPDQPVKMNARRKAEALFEDEAA